jgi:hypothetical protein
MVFQMERLGQQQRDEVTAQAALFDATLETSPDDLEALEVGLTHQILKSEGVPP